MGANTENSGGGKEDSKSKLKKEKDIGAKVKMINRNMKNVERHVNHFYKDETYGITRKK